MSATAWKCTKMGKMKMCVFLASNLLRVSPMRLTTHYHHTRYEENGSEGKFSLRMPRRNSSIFKPPVLIQFQVTADTDRHHQQIEHAKGPEAGGGAQRPETPPAHQRPHPH